MSKTIRSCVALFICFGLTALAQGPQGQQAQPAGRGRATAPPRPDNPQSLAHIDAAKKLAGDDPFLKLPFDFYCVAGTARPNNANAPEVEPTKLFDDLYMVGNSESPVYVLTTSDGIILFDAGYADKVETVMVAGLQKLGLDPAQVKYILVGHGHADHYGGAAFFQQKYGTRVGLFVGDWDLLAKATPQQATPPKRDLVLMEGQPVKLGETVVTVVPIPGHTAGSGAFLFPVKDRGRTRTAGLFGGTILTSNIISTDGLKQYVASIGHYLDVAKKMNVEVEVQNHPLFDDTPGRLARLRTMTGNQPNPFAIGTDRYVRMWSIISECIQAEIARRGTAAL